MTKKALLISAITFGVVLGGLAFSNIADTFLVQKAAGSVSENASVFNWDDTTATGTTTSDSSTSGGTSTSTSSGSTSTSSSTSTSAYSETTVTLTTKTYANSGKSGTGTGRYYIVDIKLKKLSDLRTHVATNSSGNYGENITAKTSAQVATVESQQSVTVLAAINGDYCYYSGRDGYVIRNGSSYRSSQRDDYTTGEDFAIFKDGTVKAYSEADYSASEILAMNGGCWQSWAFGPALVKEGSVAVTSSQEIDGMHTSDNPRTAIGYIGTNHFCFFVCDGRDTYTGLTLYQMAGVMKAFGCQYAYNFDGGGSTTLYYGGGIKNDPSDNTGERSVSDIVYAVNS